MQKLKRGYYYLSSPERDIVKHSSDSTLNDVFDSARKIYYSNTEPRKANSFITALFKNLSGVDRPIVIYGRFGGLAQLILREAIGYSKTMKIFISDKRLDTEYEYPMQAIRYEDIKDLNPYAIIIAAAISGKEIRAALDKLQLEDTIIYPAYDFSDEVWYEFNAPLTTPDGMSILIGKKGLMIDGFF